jgi:hypothetical protein
MKAVELTYDIPKKSGLTNPSPVLRRVGFRVNFSTWALPQEKVPYPLLAALTEGGARWTIVKYDAGEADKLIGMAVEALRQEVARAGRSAEQSCERARERIEVALRAEGATPDATEAESERYWRRCRSALRRAERLLEDAERAALSFGVGGSVRTDEMDNHVVALRHACKAQAAVYAEMARAVRGTPLEAAAADGEVPPLVLADFVEEECEQDASAARVAFAE